jgi:glycosyltransferase involved in cell wall biosynthesis
LTNHAAAQSTEHDAGADGPRPDASVVIPALNAGSTLDAQLAALAAQVGVGKLEIIVVDNGSTDDTCEVVRRWQARLPGLRLLDATEKLGPSYARNRGIAAASSDRILLCDADDVVHRDWAQQLLPRLAEAAVVSGKAIWVDSDGKFLHEDQPFTPRLGFLYSFSGSNAALRRSVWNELGGFDEGLATAEDLELAWRIQLAGHRVVREDSALIDYRQRANNRDVFIQSYRHGRGTVRIYQRYATRGMPRSSTSIALKAWLMLVVKSGAVWSAPEQRAFWYQRFGTRCGRLVESVRQRVLYL